MKNKKRLKSNLHLLGLIGLLTLLLPSCSKWLDVRPSTQVAESDQFSSEQGYKDALIGLYQKMSDNSSYGKELTYGTVDVLAQLYENKASEINDPYGQIARYNYTAAGNQDLIDKLWRGQYSIIAQTNYILKSIDQNKGLFQGQNYNIVKGEALAIRALVHFDLLRLFAPALVALSNPSDLTIPYVTSFTVQPQKAGTFSQVMNAVISDLKEAEELLSVNQTIDQIKDNAGSTSLEIFGMFRQNRLNYWAVKGLLARAYLYNNQKELALANAKAVIESKKFMFIPTIGIDNDAASKISNVTFSTEHLFSVYKSDLRAVSEVFFKVGETNTGAELEDLYTTRDLLYSYYETTEPGYSTDIRGMLAASFRWLAFDTKTVYTTKYYVGKDIVNVNQKLVPVIRLPEMYYIAAECETNLDESLNYLNEVRLARLIPALSKTKVNSAASLEVELFKEYRKEFYAEGQLWFYYKRKNYNTLVNSVGGTMNNTKYVLPYPLAEIEFGIN